MFLSLLLLVPLSIIPAISLAAEANDVYLHESRRDMLREAQERLFNDDFKGAHNRADELVGMDPEDPLGYLFRAAILLGEMTRAEENLYNDDFHSLIDTVRELAQNRLEVTSASVGVWMYLCLGHASAYESLWESRFGSFVSAVKLGFKARSAYEKGLELDSSLYDLYGGLGMYHYWKSAKAGILRWLGIFKNDRQRGLDELYLTIDSSQISAETARNALIWIWLDKKQYDSVAAISTDMYSRYPDGTLFLWPIATACYEQKDYTGAIEAYRTLDERLSLSPGNYYNLVECHYNLYRCYDRIDQKNSARQVARRLLDYYDDIPENTKRRQRSKLAFLKRAADR